MHSRPTLIWQWIEKTGPLVLDHDNNARMHGFCKSLIPDAEHYGLLSALPSSPGSCLWPSSPPASVSLHHCLGAHRATILTSNRLRRGEEAKVSLAF